MIDSLFTLTSALLGLVLLNCTALIGARAWCLRWIGPLPLEIRYTIWLTLIFLIGLNGNQWMPGYVLFPMLVAGSVGSVFLTYRRLTPGWLSELLPDFLSLFSVQLAVLMLVFFAFQFQHHWLLESHNHDSLFYYYGAHWSNESRLFVGSEAVRSKWGFHTWIGFDQNLYRGGTYTLAAWIQYFAPRITGNGLYLIAAYSATFAWFSVRLFVSSTMNLSNALVCSFCALLVSCSTGLVGSLVNSNLATVMGAASIVLILAIALRSDIRPNVRYALMAACCAVCAHFYGEAVFYAIALIFFVLLFEILNNIRSLKFLGEIRLILVLGFIIIILGNIPVIQATSSLLFLTNVVAKAGDWFSWYLHNSQIWWVGSFLSGLLMGGKVSVPIVALSSVIAIVTAAFLVYQNQTRVGTLALICTSVLAIFYIKTMSYQYGEHKILQLLGPCWALLVVVAIIRLFKLSNSPVKTKKIIIFSRFFSIAIAIAILIVFSKFALSSALLLDHMRGYHSLDFGLKNLVSYIRVGDTVLLDDSEWNGAERYLKTHYAAFELQRQGAKVVMPDLDGNELRGGYQRKNLNNTFGEVTHVQWLVKARRQGSKEKFVSAYEEPVFSNSDYLLYRVGKRGVFTSGKGWYDCEQMHCWTSAPFEIEVYAPTESGQFIMALDFSAFHPPKSGLITIRTPDGQILKRLKAVDNQAKFRIPSGWSRLVFEPNWPIYSPKELGISKDDRRLFLAIYSIKIDQSN
jgi:hypothetical protein